MSLSPAPDLNLAPALQPYVDRGTLAGAVVLVADHEQLLGLEAVGYADLETQRLMQTDDLFWVASMNKPITATAAMMLVDQGLLDVDVPVEQYLPEFRGQMVIAAEGPDHRLLHPPAHPVTVRNLLSHTGGLISKSPLEQTQPLDVLSLREAVLSFALSPLKWQPDIRYEYCNPGITTIGRLIEVLAEQPYEEFLQERLFDPLGMSETTFWPTETQCERLATSYRQNDDGRLEPMEIGYLTYPLSDRSRQPYPGGGLFSTAADLLRFGQMVLNEGELDGRRYLSPAAVRQMTSNQIGELVVNADNEHAGYGFGWSARRRPEEPDTWYPFGHGGAYGTNLTIDPPRDLVTVYLVQHCGYGNDDGGELQPAFQQAVKEALGR